MPHDVNGTYYETPGGYPASNGQPITVNNRPGHISHDIAVED